MLKETIQNFLYDINEQVCFIEIRSTTELEGLKNMVKEMDSLKNKLDDLAKDFITTGSEINDQSYDEKEIESRPIPKKLEKNKETENNQIPKIHKSDDNLASKMTIRSSMSKENFNKERVLKNKNSMLNFKKVIDDPFLKSGSKTPRKSLTGDEIKNLEKFSNYTLNVISDNTKPKNFQRTQTVGYLGSSSTAPTKKNSSIMVKNKLNAAEEKQRPTPKRTMTFKTLSFSKDLIKDAIPNKNEKTLRLRSNSKSDLSSGQKKNSINKNQHLSTFGNKERNNLTNDTFNDESINDFHNHSNIEIHTEINEFILKDEEGDDYFKNKIEEIEQNILKLENKNNFEIIEQNDDSRDTFIIDEPKIEPIEYLETLKEKGLLPNLFKYFSRKDHFISFPSCKFLGSFSLNFLLEESKKELKDSKSKFEKFKIKHCNDCNFPNEAFQPFLMSRGASRAIDLLNESIYNKIFAQGNNISDDVKLIYRILFILINRDDIGLIQGQSEFWKVCSNYIITEGSLIVGMVKKFDFSEKNIYKINKLVENQVNKITPAHFSKICATTGLLIFLIKDAMEYAGVAYQEKKTPYGRMMNNFKFEIEMAETKIDKFTNLLEGPYKF